MVALRWSAWRGSIPRQGTSATESVVPQGKERNTMAVIRSKEYDKAELRLMKDPIVYAMSRGLAGVPRDQMCHDDGTPRFEFMMAANNEYRSRGGEDGFAIGTVAHALLRLLDQS